MSTVIFFIKWGAVLLALYYMFKYMFSVYRLNKELRWIPGPSIISGILEVIGQDQVEFAKLMFKMHGIYGPVFKIWLGPNLYIFVKDPEFCQILAGTGKRARKSKPYEYLKLFCGLSVLTSYDDVWYRKRKLLTPCFHYEILDEFMGTMNTHSKKLVSYLSQYADTGESFEFFEIAKLCTLDILMDTVMGLNINAVQNKNNSYVKAINRMREIVMTRTISPFYKNDFIYNFSSMKKIENETIHALSTFVQEVIKTRKEYRKKADGENQPREGKRKKAMLDMFLDMNDAGVHTADEEIENEVNTFIFAGHDTTSVAVSYTLYLLGRNPEIQEKVYDELMTIIPNIMETTLTQNDINKLEYLDRCIKETLRIYSPVPLIGKIFDEPFQTDKGIIPANVNISQNIHAMHNDEDLFPQPNIFDPDRFLQSTNRKHPHSYIPFASGARNCIGQKFALNEVKLIVAHLVKNYKLESLQEPEDLKIAYDLVLTPFNGIHIKIQRRQNDVNI